LYVDLRLALAQSLLAGSRLELDEQNVMRSVVRPNDVALDIGAHMGYHTTLLSHLVGPGGKVHAFEPNPEILPALRHTVNTLDNTVLHSFALSDHSGTAILFIPKDPSMASLKDWTSKGNRKARLQPSTHRLNCGRRRLDDLVAMGLVQHPDFVKCDVEGAELLVFQGSRQSLNQVDAPLVLFEANPNASHAFGDTGAGAMAFLSTLERPRYIFFKIGAGGRLEPTSDLSLEGTTHCNLLAVPEARLHRLSNRT
jgi:FkbM family methyltransferase